MRSSRAEDAAPDPHVLQRLQRLSIVGLLVLALTASFAAIDWLMSLEPDWFSTMYPGMVAMGMLLLAFAFAVLVIALLSNLAPLAEVVTPKVLNELGSLLLAFVMLWTYMAYFQYLLIWAGNLADEIPWYTRRLDGGWVWIALIVAAAGFAAPFVLLLFRGLKRKRATLIAIAAVLIGSRLVEAYWLVAPAFERGGPRLELACTSPSPWVLEACGWLSSAGAWPANRCCRPTIRASRPHWRRRMPPPEGTQRSDANFGLIALGGGALLVMLVVAVVAITSLQSALSGVAPSFVAPAGVTALATPVAPPGCTGAGGGLGSGLSGIPGRWSSSA